MDDIEKRLRAKLHRHLVSEGDVIPFPVKNKKPDLTQKLIDLSHQFPQDMEAQEIAEEEVMEKADRIFTRGESSKKKFYLPFIMNNYQEGTHPIEALLWTLSEYLESGDTDYEYSRDQLRFAYQFLSERYDEMVSAVTADIATAEQLWQDTLKLKISLPGYAARPVGSLLTRLKDMQKRLQMFGMYDGIFAHPERKWSEIQAKRRDELLTEEVTAPSTPFDVTNTNFPYYNDMLKSPEYFENEKGIVFVIMYMSPDEYIQRSIDGFAKYQDIHGDLVATRSAKLAKEYAERMLVGDKFPMPFLNYTNLGFEQEGLHRAVAAKMAGVKTMPVMIIDNTPERRERIRKQQESGSWW